ncbi:protein disabled-like isoform X2 [Tubulanus polymorphus]|uniref:protein disabled-like isoform X2 n=1 Tax=Tubulanus polymorphus TaxID=672921 RepID=UPI003DA5034F
MSEDVASTKSSKKDKSKAKSIDDMLDPARFRGDGVVFKGKMIGTTPVENARGDRMCQEAMQRVKLDVKAAGVHKQKVTIQITLDGMKIIDEKLGKVEHQHPVHRISFISRDVTDARAFGYVFGNKDGTHVFFGIKSEKASEHLVLTLRDLFQVVFELKKKEMDAKKAQADKDKDEPLKENQKSADKENQQPSEKKDESDYEAPRKLEFVTSRSEENPENVGTLLDLATELESIQQQMNAFESDPFSPTPLTIVTTGPPQPGIDPFGASTNLWATASQQPSQTFQTSQSTDLFGQPAFQPQPGTFPPQTEAVASSSQQGSFQYDKYSVFEDLSTLQNPTLFHPDEPLNTGSPVPPAMDLTPNPFAGNSPLLPKKEQTEKPDSRPSSKPSSKSGSMENLFSDLDPLGGNRPYVRKEEMFAEFKVQPKVTLKDLSLNSTTADNVKDNSNQSPTTMLFASQSNPTKPPRDVPFCAEADFDMPSPRAPPPPLPNDQKVILPDVAPAPPPRPQQLDTCGIPKLTPPAPVPRQRTLGTKPAVAADPFAMDPFFASANGTNEAIAAFDVKFPADPFASPVNLQEPVYAIVNKDDNQKRES